MISRCRVPSRWSFLWLAVAVVVVLVLIPGLSGPFLLDDFPNLQALSRLHHAAPTFPAVASYILSGNAGFFGRPLTLLTFAAQASAWPRDPFAFKLVNVGIHLLNGFLLIVLCYRLTRLYGYAAERARFVALAVGSIWLIHPLQAAAVFYVVQRMTLLSATFTLTGLLCYLTARVALANGHRTRAFAWGVVGIFGAGLLAVLSKENGVLLPVYALVVEFTLLRALPRPRTWWPWLGLTILPLIVGLAYFLWHFQEFMVTGYVMRAFTPAQRLLTEARVIIDYAGQIVFPRTADMGVFHDDYLLSTSLWAPPATVLAITLLALAVVGAIAARRRYPEFSFAIAWFLGGQLLVSTVIPLELYFDHRNYLPMMGLLLGAAMLLSRWAKHAPQYRRYLLIAVVGWSLLVGYLGWRESRLWGRPFVQAVVWAREHPASPRAQQYLAAAWLATGQEARAVRLYQALAARPPWAQGTYATWLAAHCQYPRLPLPPAVRVLTAFGATGYSNGVTTALGSVVDAWVSGQCRDVGAHYLARLLRTLLNNPDTLPGRADLWLLLGRVQMRAQRPTAAMASFRRLWLRRPTVESALLLVGALAAAGHFTEARKLLAAAQAVNRLRRGSRTVGAREIAAWRDVLRRTAN